MRHSRLRSSASAKTGNISVSNEGYFAKCGLPTCYHLPTIAKLNLVKGHNLSRSNTKHSTTSPSKRTWTFRYSQKTRSSFANSKEPQQPMFRFQSRNAHWSKANFLRTDDLCRVDSAGFLFVEGRLKDLIIVAGRNIYPQVKSEIPDVFIRIKHLKRCCYFSVCPSIRVEHLLLVST